MSECCKSCKRRLDLKMSDYSQGGCRDYELGGYICLAFVDEGKAIWMIGQNEYTGFCECFMPKEES